MGEREEPGTIGRRVQQLRVARGLTQKLLAEPVYTVFAGRMGGVDEQLVADGRLELLEHADDVRLIRRSSRGDVPRLLHDRDPSDLLEVLLGGIPVLEAPQTS